MREMGTRNRQPVIRWAAPQHEMTMVIKGQDLGVRARRRPPPLQKEG